jgi:hypothetical protein
MLPTLCLTAFLERPYAAFISRAFLQFLAIFFVVTKPEVTEAMAAKVITAVIDIDDFAGDHVDQ